MTNTTEALRARIAFATLAVLSAAAICIGTKATAEGSASPAPIVQVTTPAGAVTLPSSLTEVAEPSSIAFAAAADGMNYFVAKGAHAGESCLIMAAVGASPEVAPASCGTPPPGVLNVLTQSMPDGSRVGAVVLPAGATAATVNGIQVRGSNGVATFEAPSGPIAISAASGGGAVARGDLPAVAPVSAQP